MRITAGESGALRRGRQCALLAGALAVLTQCGQGGTPPIGTVGHVSGFLGFALADEPRAALVGRDVLSSGGSAADAAVAMYFALSVTMPVTAGLGGGGACVAHETKGKKTEALDFMPRPSTAALAPGTVAAALPSNVRGMAALYGRHGLLRWEQLVFPAERLARFGHPASRAFVTALGDAFNRLPPDANVRALYLRADGTLPREGDAVLQLDLAGVLGQIRANGAGELYSGAVARRVFEGAREGGIALAYEELQAVRPAWVPPARASFGNHAVDLPPSAGGQAAASLWRTLGDERRFGRGSAAERVYGLYQAAAQSALGPVQPYDPGVAAFAALDSNGNAVACAVTLNGPFGTGRVIRGTGIAAAKPPAPGADPAIAIAPVIVANQNNGNTFFVAAPSGASAAAALAAVMVRTLGDRRPLDEAMAEPRVAPAGPGAAALEAGAPPDVASRLAAAGVRVTQVPALGAVGAIACPDGFLNNRRTCVGRADPRGFGFAAGGAQ